ncbi:hypothetical protein MVES1_001884 [Malassezia vespertilionis]|uniref:uncharacterized protein n=1 Tax=Malassezia vespertilionis TaxID=2020962 RepID=UPI0024B0D4D8|nr:uncharacterized protein MVES1_001884 [Malassezia vespertilionis]WFD06534.1 hypothetical protein MVES1_001884 [Malassezia vespertilionis]
MSKPSSSSKRGVAQDVGDSSRTSRQHFSSPTSSRDADRRFSASYNRQPTSFEDYSIPPRRGSVAPSSLGSSVHVEDERDVQDFEKKDDEYKARDRGEALIRHRMRERKREKLMKHSDARIVSLPGTPGSSNSQSTLSAFDEETVSAKDKSALRTSISTVREGKEPAQDNEGSDQTAMRDDDPEFEPAARSDCDDLEYTLKDRQDALNFEHPFGLPIWKPALYKKSRSITRNAETALKSAPGQQLGYRAVPGNILWLLFFGIWLAALCFVLSTILYLVPTGGRLYSRVLFGLGSYILWPFGNYVEVECSHVCGHRHGPLHMLHVHEHNLNDNDQDTTHADGENESTLLLSVNGADSASDYNSIHPHDMVPDDNITSEEERIAAERGVYHYVYDEQGRDIGVSKRWAGIIVYAFFYVFVIFPTLGLVCLLCWALVITVPMGKTLWVLLKNLAIQPLALHFRSPLQIDTRVMRVAEEDSGEDSQRVPMLRVGQVAPQLKAKHRKKGTSKRRSVILLCNYSAMGFKYFKYTIGGVNILFINTLPIVFLVILNFFVMRPILKQHGVTTGLLAFLASDEFIFLMSLASVMPLSYFIGMAVASISAQSSIGMGAVINATFGSIIELLLYSIALVQGRSNLVEGSLIGSILAGVLLLPGISMCSGATRRKEQKFNSQSAGVTSTMLIMAIIGILTPTIFYQIYGTFELTCSGCPDQVQASEDSWKCTRCSYEHIPTVLDSFFQTSVKNLTYTCAVILMLSYGIGIWFSLRTHASQIWNNAPPAPISTQANMSDIQASLPPGLHRASVYKRLLPPNYLQQMLPSYNEQQTAELTRAAESLHDAPAGDQDTSKKASADDLFLDGVARVYQYIFNKQKATQQSAAHGTEEVQEEHGGHDAPSWSRMLSLSVLLGCTVLYAIIAEILVDVVDVVVQGFGLSEKFIGVTIFALVPNTTEFMNAISFALHGNIALSLEIGSAYALQVSLIQIPVLVGFSAWYNSSYKYPTPDLQDHSFTLVFPRWDIIAIIFAIFLLTYTYIEARSNYHRGSILILAYTVFVAGFYFAPNHDPDQATDPTLNFGRSWRLQNNLS